MRNNFVVLNHKICGNLLGQKANTRFLDIVMEHSLRPPQDHLPQSVDMTTFMETLTLCPKINPKHISCGDDSRAVSCHREVGLIWLCMSVFVSGGVGMIEMMNILILPTSGSF